MQHASHHPPGASLVRKSVRHRLQKFAECRKEVMKNETLLPLKLSTDQNSNLIRPVHCTWIYITRTSTAFTQKESAFHQQSPAPFNQAHRTIFKLSSRWVVLTLWLSRAPCRRKRAKACSNRTLDTRHVDNLTRKKGRYTHWISLRLHGEEKNTRLHVLHLSFHKIQYKNASYENDTYIQATMNYKCRMSNTAHERRLWD